VQDHQWRLGVDRHMVSDVLMVENVLKKMPMRGIHD
jgi:hypothetical protein